MARLAFFLSWCNSSLFCFFDVSIPVKHIPGKIDAFEMFLSQSGKWIYWCVCIRVWK